MVFIPFPNLVVLRLCLSTTPTPFQNYDYIKCSVQPTLSASSSDSTNYCSYNLLPNSIPIKNPKNSIDLNMSLQYSSPVPVSSSGSAFSAKTYGTCTLSVATTST